MKPEIPSLHIQQNGANDCELMNEQTECGVPTHGLYVD
jgi:hypothetical protein